MRADKKANIAKVAKIALKEPLLTRDEIAEKAWVSQWTASNVLKELDETWRKSPEIIKITTKDKRAIELAQIIIEQSLEKYVEMSEAAWWLEMNEALRAAWLAKEATARYTLFWWEATDKDWWMKLPDVTFQIVNPNADTEDTSETI